MVIFASTLYGTIISKLTF